MALHVSISLIAALTALETVTAVRAVLFGLAVLAAAIAVAALNRRWLVTSALRQARVRNQPVRWSKSPRTHAM
jgi:hypothetical protein